MSKLINLDEVMDSIHEQEQKTKEATTQFENEDILRLQPGHTYVGRFLPNLHDKENHFYSYEEYGFNSVQDNRYIYAGRTPFSVGRKDDPIKKLQWETYSKGKAAGDEATMKRSYTLFPQQKQLVNFYVIDDPVTPENNGKVKIIRYSSKVDKNGEPMSPLFAKIHNAVNGDEQDEIGKRAFDLTGNGVNFAIKVKKNSGGWNDYSESTFKFPSDLGLSESEIMEIYKSTYDLEKYIPEVKTNEELKEILDVHWFGSAAPAAANTEEADLSDLPSDSTDDTPVAEPAGVTELDDDMDDFISDLDNLSD